MPELAGRSLVLNDRVVTGDPRYFQGSAILDGAYIVKFAWSEPPARRIVREGRVLAVLADACGGLAVPTVVPMAMVPRCSSPGWSVESCFPGRGEPGPE